MKLNKVQQEIMAAFDHGDNIFITGPGGVGKSMILKHIADTDQLYKKIAVTATTGVAAHLIGGMTIHSFAGIQRGEKDYSYYVKNMTVDVKKRWFETDVFIIDEASMWTAKLFKLVHEIACAARQNDDELFGGILLILSGDFYQFPPVEGGFIFTCNLWLKIEKVFVLTESYRQKDDEAFFKTLNNVRVGKLNSQDVDFLMQQHRGHASDIPKTFPRLYFTNKKVDAYNQVMLNSMQTEEKLFRSVDEIKVSEVDFTFQIPSETRIKVNALVMITKNIDIDNGLCNGAMGKVVSFNDLGVTIKIKKTKHVIPLLKEEILDAKDHLIASRFGLPLQVSFAITVYKAQGLTMEGAVVDMNSKAFCNSLYYVAFSRVILFSNLFLIHDNSERLRELLNSITADKNVVDIYNVLKCNLRKRKIIV
ncbi:TPA_asm: S1H [Hydra MELD virus]|nr:TPA_asm: S1H [Hydra MELD virus]